MKKLLILLVVACIAMQAQSQKSFFGIDAGVNVANQRTHFSTTLFNSTQAGTGFYQNAAKPTLGIFYQVGFNEQLGLRLGVRYMGMGYQIQATSENVDINYLTLPVAIHYFVNKKLSFNTGPYLSFTLGGTKINNQSITSTYHKNDHGFSFGGEYDLSKNVAVALNYFIGLKNILLDDSIVDINNNKIGEDSHTNRALQFTLIYKFKKTI